MTDTKEYFERARDWATDARIRDARLIRYAWIVAGVATAIALFEAVALAMLTPLKSVQPVALLVDRQTGYVQALDPLQPRRIGADAALTQSLLAQYVTSREGFDRATVSNDYRRVALWSAGPARAQYLSLMPASNPQSPLQRFPAGAVQTAHVKSVSKLSEGVALVRFDTQLQDRTGRNEPARPWVAIVRYRYSDAPMSFENRLVNPLGFQVTGYRRDAEMPTEQPATPQSLILGPTETTPGNAPTNYVAPPGNSARQAAGFRKLAWRGMLSSHIPMGSPLLPAARSADSDRHMLR